MGMEAYKCDRCGKLYELSPKQTVMRRNGVNYGVYNSLNNYHLDLCEKCFYELQEWMTVCIEAENKRDCKTCIHSDNGKCAYTEECHECMWESQYEADKESEDK